MDEQLLADALEQSIQWLTEGRSVTDCLQAFPELADQLAPLLEAGIVVRRAQVRSFDVMAAQNRVRLKLQARQRRRNQFDLLSRLVAVIVVICFASLLLWQSPRIFEVLSRLRTTETSTASPTIAASATASETATMSMTPTPSPSPTLTAIPSNTTVPPASKTPVPRQPTIQLLITRNAPTTTNGSNNQLPSRVPQSTNQSPASPVGEQHATEAPQATSAENHSNGSGSGSTEPTEPPG
jgi:cytoskeletal protein RodZ